MNLTRRFNFFRNRSITKKTIILAGIGAAMIVSAFLLLVFVVWAGFLGPLPDKEELKNIENHQATEVYSADSVLLGRYFIQERSSIRYEDISEAVINALIATEDARFYSHNGIDYRSLGRVLFKTILFQRESAGGGSTITQQLVKNIYPRKRYLFLSVPVNKIREAIIATRLEKVYNKQEILTLYLNTVPFSGNTYGIQSAADRFFSTTASALTAEQAAVLIGMLKGTHLYNPRLYPERAKGRRNVVLHQMKKYGYLEAAAVDSLTLLPVALKYNKTTHHSGLAPYFREQIREQLLAWCKSHYKENGEPYNLFTDGLKIYTTVHSTLQRYAEVAVKEKMTQLQDKFFRHWGKKDPWNGQEHILDNAIRHSPRYRSLRSRGLSHEEVIAEMQKPVPMSIFNWGGEKEVKMSPIDSIKHHLKFLNTGFLAMDPSTGAVLAWVGGINHRFFQYDHVRLTTKRQVGSVIKPIIYLAALEQGERPCNYTSAKKTVFTNMDDWSPSNSDEDYDKKYSMEGALAYSVNTVSVKLLEKTGISNVVSLARKLGITSTIPEVPSIALGTPSISMMEMVTAYSVIANGGYAVEPYMIKTIADRENNVLEQFELLKGSKVVAFDNTQLIIHMLKRVVSEGTGAALRYEYGLQNDIAGKTGTTQSNTDGWFIAMSPQLVVGTWVGADIPVVRFRSTALGQGASTALPIVARFYQLVNNDNEFKEITEAEFFPLPEELKREVDCALYKTDKNLLEKIFGKSKREAKRAYNEKEKPGLFKRLFGRQ